MHSMSKSLQILARQMGADEFSRAELEAKLEQLMWLILRTGQGHPALLRWVRLAWPGVSAEFRSGDQVDPQWAARRLARLLCAQLFQDVRAQRDTMRNRQTVVA